MSSRFEYLRGNGTAAKELVDEHPLERIHRFLHAQHDNEQPVYPTASYSQEKLRGQIAIANTPKLRRIK